MFDIIIKNGKIIDGTGSPAYLSDVAVKDGKIVKVCRNIKGDAKEVIDARGLVVTPGFIDSHAHSEWDILYYPSQPEKIEQGITTSIGGQCGGSASPLPKGTTRETADIIPGVGNEMDYFATPTMMFESVKDVPQGANTALLMGHSSIRRAVIGVESRKPTPEEMEQMKAILREGMDNGAFGLSYGLIYAPGCYADTEELVEMAKVVAEYNGVIAAHIRDEGDRLAAAAAEFINVAKKANVRAVLSHHKAATRSENWGKVKHTIAMMDQCNAEGYEIYCDVYPYDASHTSLITTFTPKEFRARTKEEQLKDLKDPQKRAELREWNVREWGEDLSWVQIAQCDAIPEYKGLRMNEVAKLHGKEEYETLFDILVANNLNGTACYFTISEDDICTILSWPRAMIGTDGGSVRGGTMCHPRTIGTFPRVLGRFVREKGVTSLPEMIRKMTAMPAAVYGLKTKGLIWEGMDADICIFDPDKIIDRSTFTDCIQKAEGLNYVLVNGEVVAQNAVANGKLKGKVIRREN